MGKGAPYAFQNPSIHQDDIRKHLERLLAGAKAPSSLDSNRSTSPSEKHVSKSSDEKKNRYVGVVCVLVVWSFVCSCHQPAS